MGMNGKTDCVELLLKHMGENVQNGQDTGLHKAASKGHNSTVEALVNAGVSLDCRNHQNCTALHQAVSHAQHETLRLLIDLKASVNARVGKPEDVGWTALHWACFNGCNEIVGLLLDSGASLDMEDLRKQTPAALAMEKGHTSILLLLKEPGKKPGSDHEDTISL